jgi:C4-dicarboxylate transporter
MLKKILILIVGTIATILLFRYCEFKKDSESTEYNTNLIQQQIVNVGKLVVTEGHFAQVLTYKDQDDYFAGMLSFKKKALLVVNADVTVSYDLRQVKYDIDEKTRPSPS